MLAGSVAAAPLPAAATFWQSWEDRVVETRLPNGFTLLVVERHESPTVACWMFCRAGAAQEARSQTGLAHMLEHMLFKGTETVGTTDHLREKPFLDEQDRLAAGLLEEEGRPSPDPARLKELRRDLEESLKKQRALMRPEEYGEILRRHGGVNLNAGTSLDYTVYHIELPANRLELWAALESDRLLHPVFREFYKERDVVMEERRRSRDGQPDGALFEEFLSAAFTAHPYGVPTIGWMDDIRRLQRKDAESFYRANYTADRFVAVVVGDVKADAVKAMVARYFGALPAGSGIRLEPTVEPPQKGERRITVEFDASPQVIMGFHKPTQPHPDVYALDVLSQILTGGRTGRLTRRLLVRERAAVSVWADGSFPAERYPNLFVIGFIPRAPHTAEEVERTIQEEIGRLATQPVTADELSRVKTMMAAGAIRGLAANAGLAQDLGYAWVETGDWREVFRDLPKFQAVTAADVMRAARAWLTPANRTIAILRRPAAKS